MDTQKTTTIDFIVIGGGASGFFGAINLARRGLKVVVLEKFQKVLSKLAVSGGGRCNVTHHEYDPKKLTANYPRGQKALLGPFFKFTPQDMIQWLKESGVEVKIEADGRIFPITDSSSTIIDCFVKEALASGVEIKKGVEVEDMTINEDFIELKTTLGPMTAKKVLVATGSSKSMWQILEKIGHTIVPPVASLFALNTPSSPFLDLSGLSLKTAALSYNDHTMQGPLLFTHFGLSGPCALKLSSFAAREFAKNDYKATLSLDFLPSISSQELIDFFNSETKTLSQLPMNLPKRLWEKLILVLQLDKHKPLNHISKAQKLKLVDAMKKFPIKMEGKTTHKEEFVTAGGVDLDQVNFSTMQSKLFPNLYFAGEVLNIDAITGGFNFQAAWTTSYLISTHF